MSLHLRFKALSTAPLPNIAEAVLLDPQYEFSAVVDLLDLVISREGRVKLRTADGGALVLKSAELRSLAIRQEH